VHPTARCQGSARLGVDLVTEHKSMLGVRIWRSACDGAIANMGAGLP